MLEAFSFFLHGKIFFVSFFFGKLETPRYLSLLQSCCCLTEVCMCVTDGSLVRAKNTNTHPHP